MLPSNRRKDLQRLYGLLERLQARTGFRRLETAHAQDGWPEKGVYFFFEEGETREDVKNLRVVRVGTHAINGNAHTTLWNRLSQHQGTIGGANPGGGNHRGSVFRDHVGRALIASGDIVNETWAHTHVTREEHEAERLAECRVSRHIRSMPFLWLSVPGAPGPDCPRSYIERNSIALLSNKDKAEKLDPQSENWLGNHSPHPAIRGSGLWNVNHVDEGYDPLFLDIFERLVEDFTGSERPSLSGPRIPRVFTLSRPNQVPVVRKTLSTGETPGKSMSADPRTLILIPCCARKLPGGSRVSGTFPAPLPNLSPQVRQGVVSARSKLLDAMRGQLPETQIEYGPDFGGSSMAGKYRPAWERYAGNLYSALGDRKLLSTAGKRADESCVLILSALYGPLEPDFPIQDYDLRMDQPLSEPGRPSLWGKPEKAWKTILPGFLREWMRRSGKSRILLLLASHYLKAAGPAVETGLSVGWISEAFSCSVIDGNSYSTPHTHGLVLKDLLTAGKTEQTGVEWVRMTSR